MDNDGTLSERNILRFLTAVAIYEDDGYFAQLAMGDDPMVPKNYVTLQSVNVITEQDLSLDLDGVFIECSA
ncbi:MAG TPA: hypothetical protein VJS15_10215, partial [Allosphingosinicella sp.]|nr:hypothetical protein [Allosphingosinicella sp.]